MGQQIEIKSSTVVGNMLIIDTNRSITGQNGEAYGPDDDRSGPTLPAKLADEILEAVNDVDHVFAASSTVSLRTSTAWEETAVEAANTAVRNFFTYWNDNRT